MIILPSKEYNNPNNEKITTYQFLSNVGCPVFDSVLFDENESITKEKLITLKEDELKSKQVDGTQMWLLQPIDRTKNIYGINMYVNKKMESLIIESVGKGFDVSDLNRGDISPQESIYLNYPIEYGWQKEWWKYIKLNQDKLIRLNKLKKFDLNPNENIFDKQFVPMDYSLIEKLLNHIQSIDENWDKSDEYTVSISMNSNGKLVFWDIQTPVGKSKILRRTK